MRSLLPNPEREMFRGCSITNIRRGKNGKLYANMLDKSGALIMAATLDHCVKTVNVDFPEK